MHRASGGDDIRRLQIVVGRRSNEIEQAGRQPRIENVECEGARALLHRKRDRRAPVTGGDDETWPGRGERLARGDRSRQSARRHIDLQPLWNEPQATLHAHPLDCERNSDGLSHGDGLVLVAGRAVGDDPALRGGDGRGVRWRVERTLPPRGGRRLYRDVRHDDELNYRSEAAATEAANHAPRSVSVDWSVSIN